MKVRKIKSLLILIIVGVLSSNIIFAWDPFNDFEINLTLNTSVTVVPHPIIFVHGHGGKGKKSESIKMWRGEEPPAEINSTAMKRILNEGYQGYTTGNLDCDYTTILSSTGGDTKKIYNFSYYGDSQQGAIGSNGNILPEDDGVRSAYISNVNSASWSKRLADFIDKVLVATGSDKVDIVAYSIGGLAARAAIKWCGCDTKVHKLLMIATPNHGANGPIFYDMIADARAEEWMEDGELLELGIEYHTHWFAPPLNSADKKTKGKKNVIFYDVNNPNIKGRYYELLNMGNWAGGVRYATIAGNKNGLPLISSKDDSVFDVGEVHLAGADFNSTYYANHNSMDNDILGVHIKELGEDSLNACLYTTEFIKRWIMDDYSGHINAVAGDGSLVYPIPWKIDNSDRCYIYFNIVDWSKALVARSDMYKAAGGELYVETKAFPVYKYANIADPIYSTNIRDYESGVYVFYFRIYDMNGLVWGGKIKDKYKFFIIR